jgi:hypothetical protein
MSRSQRQEQLCSCVDWLDGTCWSGIKAYGLVCYSLVLVPGIATRLKSIPS